MPIARIERAVQLECTAFFSLFSRLGGIADQFVGDIIRERKINIFKSCE